LGTGESGESLRLFPLQGLPVPAVDHCQTLLEECCRLDRCYLGFLGLAIVTFYMMRALMIAKPAQLSFDHLVNKNGDLAYECADAYRTYAQPYIDIFIAMFRNDTHRDPKVYSFKSRDELNAWFYTNRSRDQTPIAMALGFWDFCGENCSNDLIVYWNSSESGLNAI
jgi:hypothetical protein